MPELYKLADAMLVTLEDKPYANMTIPGKVQSYMAAGKPIIGAVNGSCYNFIINNRIGYCVSSGDSEGLASVIKSLDIKELIKIGKHARGIYLNKYNKTTFINKLLFELNNI